MDEERNFPVISDLIYNFDEKNPNDQKYKEIINDDELYIDEYVKEGFNEFF